MASGPVRDAPLGVNWRQVDTALRLGLRGLPRGSSLARLLARARGVRNPSDLPRLSAGQVLAWADHHRRAGSWPTAASGPVAGAPGETWRGLDNALRMGQRGLPRGSSLARLLARERGVRNLQGLPPLSAAAILGWADAHRARAGAWPAASSGPVAGAAGETWAGVAAALRGGRRGLPGGSSLARLLARRRGARNPKGLPRLAVPEVLRWARAHERRTGRWPARDSGPVPEAPGETWSAVAAALQGGWRGLPAGLTLARLRVGQAAPRLPVPQRLSEARVLAWADAYRARAGEWPRARSGPVFAAPGETWRGLDNALRLGLRGLRGDRSLAGVLRERRGLRDPGHAPPLTEGRVLAWADAHRRRTGAWPSRRSGPVAGAAGETWRGVDDALRSGGRSLPGGAALAGLLARARGARNRAALPRLRPGRVVAWARAHRRRTGGWPTAVSGPVAGAAGETWKGLDMALRGGHRGLRGGTSLARLLALRAGARTRAGLPALSEGRVLAWAQAHRRRTGRWPSAGSGAVAGAAGETWGAVDQALRAGYRGLPGDSSLAGLLRRHTEGASEVVHPRVGRRQG
jgi:hypothetical protein